MAAYFVTGTGTDIGKTWLAAALLREARARGVATRALKPVMSGVDANALDTGDAGVLLAAQGLPVDARSVAEISPWRFAAPLSPDMAAAREGRSIDFDELVAFSCRPARAEFSGLALVEGVGGVMVPLDGTHTVIDWMAALKLPAVLVGGSYLGAMSHALTALHALATRGIPVAALALNESPDSTVDLDATAATLARHGRVPVVAIRRAAPAQGVAELANILLGPVSPA